MSRKGPGGARALRVGIDFDNTIVCYDDLLDALARERGLPADRPWTKGAWRDYLRAADREDEWTEMQGALYGPELKRARPFPGVAEFIKRCREKGVFVAVISHKTKVPFRGPKHDLQQAARDWIAANGFYDAARAGLSPSDVYLEPTKEEKLRRIAQLRCTHFIDDLPEFLLEPSFPGGVERILFDPTNAQGSSAAELTVIRSWPEVEARIFA